jgi:asparagine synthase (glutamine-hydrolysing)
LKTSFVCLRAQILHDVSGFKREVDEDAIPLFLHYQYIPAPKTIFKNTFKLLPGHYLLFDGKTLDTASYWELPEMDRNAVNQTISDHHALCTLDELLTRAVSDRLVSDVPLGALLSGGIDSSMVVALMQKVSPGQTRTFSIGFQESGYDEAPWARKVAQYLGCRHTELYVSAQEAMHVIPKLTEIYDEPFADSSAIPTLLVSRLARSKVTVALSGDGGDEQFCGYVRYWTTKIMAQSMVRLPLAMRRALAAVLRRLPSDWVAKCYLPLRQHLPQPLKIANFSDKWEKFIRTLKQTQIQELYRMTISLWSCAETKKTHR